MSPLAVSEHTKRVSDLGLRSVFTVTLQLTAEGSRLANALCKLFY